MGLDWNNFFYFYKLDSGCKIHWNCSGFAGLGFPLLKYWLFCYLPIKCWDADLDAAHHAICLLRISVPLTSQIFFFFFFLTFQPGSKGRNIKMHAAFYRCFTPDSHSNMEYGCCILLPELHVGHWFLSGLCLKYIIYVRFTLINAADACAVHLYLAFVFAYWYRRYSIYCYILL